MEHRGGAYVDGEWRASSADAVLRVVNPFTEDVFGEVGIGTAEDVDAAVSSAHRTLTSRSWTDTPLEDRIAVVLGIKALLAARADEITSVITSSMGMPLAAYRDLGNAGQLIDMYVDMVKRVRWEYLRMDYSGDALITRRPVGVVAAIVPWNVPIRTEVKKIIPAILCGCPVVLKPAPETSFSAALFAEICTEAGMPPGVVNVVLGDGTTGEHLVRHPLVRKVAFTGSTATGAAIWSAVSERFVRLQLELGGKSAAIVLDDADLETVTPSLAAGVFHFAGQQCTATSRILAPRSRYGEVVDAMVGAARAHTLGDPFDPRTTMGPLVTERQRARVLGYVDSGRSDGARVAVGGVRPFDQPRGWFVEPTVLVEVDNAMRVAREEIFGPVAVVIPYDDDAEAIRIANDSEYGLGGAVFSADASRALSLARQVDSGYVSVNRYGIPSTAPFGGVKRSGIGREHGVEGYDSFLEYVAHPLTHDLAVELAKTVPLD